MPIDVNHPRVRVRCGQRELQKAFGCNQIAIGRQQKLDGVPA
jgi:hypothetical protein